MGKPPRSFSRFAETRAQTLELAAALSQEQMDFSPGRDKWSTGQVLDHLIQVDRVFRDEFEELLKRWEKKRGGAATLVRSLSDAGFSLPMVPKAFLPFFDVPAAMAGVLLPRSLRQAVFRNRAVPAKAPRRIEPTKGRPAGELIRDLRSFTDSLDGYFSDHPDVEWERLRYYNPLTGFTNVPGILSFIGSHERRHQDQIRDILAAKDCPASS